MTDIPTPQEAAIIYEERIEKERQSLCADVLAEIAHTIEKKYTPDADLAVKMTKARSARLSPVLIVWIADKVRESGWSVVVDRSASGHIVFTIREGTP